MKQNFIKQIKVWGIIFLVGFGVGFILIDAVTTYHDLQHSTQQIRSEYTQRQQQILQTEVMHVVDMVRHKKSQAEDLTMRTIKSRVYEAYAIAENIHQQHKDTKGRAAIQQIVLDALRPIRFDNGKGYFFITRYDGIEMLFADRPRMEGLNLMDMQDPRGRYVIKDMIAIAKTSGEGFYTYHWTKPGVEGNDHKKISFIKTFEPWGWVIGCGLYVDDKEKEIKTTLLSDISNIRFGSEGYIFVNRLNGDALVSNGKVFSGNRKLWEVFDENPAQMKAVFKKEAQAGRRPDGGFIQYAHIKLSNPDEKSMKTSFIYDVPELNWLIGAGVYLDDVEGDILEMQQGLHRQIRHKIYLFSMAAAVFVGLFILFFSRLNHKLRSDIELFIDFLRNAAHSDTLINRENIGFEELDQMANYANTMISERKQAEEDLRKRKSLMNAFADALPDPAFIVDETGKCLEAIISRKNPLYQEAEALVGKPLDEIFPKQTAQAFLETIRNTIETDMPQSHEYDLTVLSETRWFIGRTSPMKEPLNGKKAVVWVAHDITERKHLEESIQRSQKMESIGNLAGGIAHDFNNILFPITGMAELLMEDLPHNSPEHEYAHEILQAGKRGAALVNQILAFSRQSEHQFVPTLIQNVLKEVMALCRSTIPTDIDIRQDIQQDCGLVMADPTQIHQVAMNIITNAYHALETGGRQIGVTLEEVTLSTEDMAADFSENAGLAPGKYALLSISDTGKGIPGDIMDKIFEPYFTTKAPGKGTGLGLAVAYGIIKEHKGTIKVHSNAGQGTRFLIYLPVMAATSALRNAAPEKTTLPRGNERILLVDDEESILRFETQMLERLGYVITPQTSPVAALEMFRDMPESFDLLLTDMTMPHMTGDQLAEAVLSIRPGMPIVVCTGFSERIDPESAKKLGIKGYLKKPIISAVMAKTIRDVLDEV